MDKLDLGATFVPCSRKRVDNGSTGAIVATVAPCGVVANRCFATWIGAPELKVLASEGRSQNGRPSFIVACAFRDGFRGIVDVKRLWLEVAHG